MEKPLADVVCINCGQCINRCPTAALYAKNALDEVWKALDDPSKYVVIQTAPSPRAAMGEMFGLEPGTTVTYEMNTGLKRMGFQKVFDTNFTADLTIIEEGTELIQRLYGALVKKDANVALPQFTSCSPGWVKYLEHFYPEFIPNLSSAKSPQQMFGALIKTYYADRDGRRPGQHRQRRGHAVHGQEVRVRPSGDVRRAATKTWTSASPPVSSAACSARPASTSCRCPSRTSTIRSARPPVRASSSAPPAA